MLPPPRIGTNKARVRIVKCPPNDRRRSGEWKEICVRGEVVREQSRLGSSNAVQLQETLASLRSKVAVCR